MPHTDKDVPWHVHARRQTRFEEVHWGCPNAQSPAWRWETSLRDIPGHWEDREFVRLHCCDPRRRLPRGRVVSHVLFAHTAQDDVESEQDYDRAARRVASWPSVTVRAWVPSSVEVVRTRVLVERECDIEAERPGVGFWLDGQCGFESVTRPTRQYGHSLSNRGDRARVWRQVRRQVRQELREARYTRNAVESDPGSPVRRSRDL